MEKEKLLQLAVAARKWPAEGVEKIHSEFESEQLRRVTGFIEGGKSDLENEDFDEAVEKFVRAEVVLTRLEKDLEEKVGDEYNIMYDSIYGGSASSTTTFSGSAIPEQVSTTMDALEYLEQELSE